MNDEEIKLLEKKQVIFIKSNDIFTIQNPYCPLWVCCLKKEKTFEEIAKQFNNDFDLLIAQGFNINFLTKDRWLDIPILIHCFKINLNQLKLKLPNLSQKQIDSWNLSENELNFFLN